MAEKKNVLIIGAHPDECEFCCGGLTLFLVEKGYRVVFLNVVGDMSLWSTVGPEKNKGSMKEAKEAAEILGAEKILLPYKTHEFTGDDFNSTREIVKVIQNVNPEIGIIHWVNDKWPDHKNVALSSFEALVQPNTFFENNFKSNLKEIYAFEASLYQTFDFYPDFYIDISDKMGKIVESFSKFKAMGEGIIKGLEREKKANAISRVSEGSFYKAEYAEAYKFLRYRPNEISILPQLLGDRFQMTRWPQSTHEYCK